MKYILFVLLLPVLTYADELTIERLFGSPSINGSVPRGIKFSPNGQRVTYLQPKPEDYEVLDLWELDLKTGEPRLLVDSKIFSKTQLTEQEKARRERMRISQKGIVEYQWSNNGANLAFPTGDGLYYFTFPNKVEKVTSKPAVDVKFSNKDLYLSFNRDRDLFILDPKSKKEFVVAKSDKETVSYGAAEFIAQEEMGRFTGYWWSDDDQYIAFTKVDESKVPLIDRYEIGADKVTVLKQRYPEAGAMNASVTLGVVSVKSVLAGKRDTQWVPLPKDAEYLARVGWTKDGKLSYQVQTRDQKKLELFLYDPKTKSNRKILEEKNDHWITLTDNLRWLKKSPQFIWSSDRSGYRHLYLVDRNGQAQALTKGEWIVDEVEGVDEDGGFIYFTATKKSPLEKHLYRVDINKPNEPEQITKAEGWHEIEVSKDNKFFIDRYSSPQTPAQVLLYKINGEQAGVLFANEVKEGHPLFPYKKDLVTPEFGEFKSASGETLYYSVRKPLNFDRRKKYPLIVMSYGGPGVQWVTKAWPSLTPQIFVQKGFVVATLDNRGTPRRGRKFEDAIYRAMGTVEVEDHAAFVKHLVSQGFIDKDRVGFYGWSYGGFLSLLLATKASDIFKANVAGAPVTDFNLYDTHYTERYLGDPKKDVEAYKRTKIMDFVPGLQGRLLVIHGMADDNVLFTNSTMLFKKLQEEGKVYESVTYPGAKHGVSGSKNQTHVVKTMVDFFERWLSR